MVSGTLDDLLASDESLTGAYLTGRRSIALPAQRRLGNGHEMVVTCRGREQPEECQRRFSARAFHCGHRGVRFGQVHPGERRSSTGRWPSGSTAPTTCPGATRASPELESIDKVVHVDQSPIGRTPRSNPATYTGVFDNDPRPCSPRPRRPRRAATSPGASASTSRAAAARTARATARSRIEMHFLPDVYVPCEVCHGHALQPGDAGGPLQGQDHRRRAGHDRRGGRRSSSPPIPAIARQAEDAGRGRAGLHAAGPARARHCRAARPSGSSWPSELQRRATGKHGLRTGRADHRPAFRRHPQSCSTCSAGWSTAATPWWSSSTTSTSSRPPTG